MLRNFGHKCIKYFLIICGIIFLTVRILPAGLSEYRVFALFFMAGNGISILVAVLAVIAYLNPVLRKRKPRLTERETTLILHDLPPEEAERLFSDLPNVKFFCSANKMASCKGFYDCWLKEPGICALRDGAENLGKEIAECGTFIIISRSLYGGLSRETKNALDRSISFALPFFHVRNKELHHQTRYENMGSMRTYIYDANGLTETEQTALSDMIKAIGVNLDKQGCETIFVRDIAHLSEVLV